MKSNALHDIAVTIGCLPELKHNILEDHMRYSSAIKPDAVHETET